MSVFASLVKLDNIPTSLVQVTQSRRNLMDDILIRSKLPNHYTRDCKMARSLQNLQVPINIWIIWRSGVVTV